MTPAPSSRPAAASATTGPLGRSVLLLVEQVGFAVPNFTFLFIVGAGVQGPLLAPVSLVILAAAALSTMTAAYFFEGAVLGIEEQILRRSVVRFRLAASALIVAGVAGSLAVAQALPALAVGALAFGSGALATQSALRMALLVCGVPARNAVGTFAPSMVLLAVYGFTSLAGSAGSLAVVAAQWALALIASTVLLVRDVDRLALPDNSGTGRPRTTGWLPAGSGGLLADAALANANPAIALWLTAIVASDSVTSAFAVGNLLVAPLALLGQVAMRLGIQLGSTSGPSGTKPIMALYTAIVVGYLGAILLATEAGWVEVLFPDDGLNWKLFATYFVVRRALGAAELPDSLRLRLAKRADLLYRARVVAWPVLWLIPLCGVAVSENVFLLGYALAPLTSVVLLRVANRNAQHSCREGRSEADRTPIPVVTREDR